VFPAATLYVGKPDVDFWFDRANATRFNVAEKYFDEAAKTVKPYLDAGNRFLARQPFYQESPRIPHPDTLLVIAAWRQARARASSFGAILFTLLRCNFPTQKLQLLMMSMPMLLRHNAKQFASGSIPILVAGAHLPFPALDTFGQQIKVMPGCQWITVNPKDS